MEIFNNRIGPSFHGRNYLLLEELGSGRNGITYKAVREKDGQQVPPNYINQPVAIKFYVNPSGLPGIQIKKEINYLVSTVRSQKVVEYLDRSPPGEELQYLVLEHLPETLEQRVRHHLHERNTSVPQELVELYLREIPALLDTLWQEKITHFDLRPSNIGIKYDELKLFDFGYARPFGKHFPSPLLNALPLYPPELRLAGKVTTTCDIYCAGKTLQRMLLGSYRHSGKEALEMIEMVQDTTLPVSFKRLLLGMTQADYRRRPTPAALQELCEDVLHDFKREKYFRPHKLMPLCRIPMELPIASDMESGSSSFRC